MWLIKIMEKQQQVKKRKNYQNETKKEIKMITNNNDENNQQIINNDKEKLIQFGNIIAIYAGVVDFYNVRLQEMNEHAINLINTLQKEYNLKDE